MFKTVPSSSALAISASVLVSWETNDDDDDDDNPVKLHYFHLQLLIQIYKRLNKCFSVKKRNVTEEG